jgi:hypothetical protein
LAFLKASRPATAQTASEPREIVPLPGVNSLNASKIEGVAQTSHPPAETRERLERFLHAIEGAGNTLRRDECRDQCFFGSRGHVFAVPGVLDAVAPGFLLYVACRSPRQWGFAKREMSFARVTQDGDAEGCLFIDRPPSEREGEIIRDRLGIRKRPLMTDARSEALQARSFAGFQPQKPPSDDAADTLVAKPGGEGNSGAMVEGSP